MMVKKIGKKLNFFSRDDIIDFLEIFLTNRLYNMYEIKKLKK